MGPLVVDVSGEITNATPFRIVVRILHDLFDGVLDTWLTPCRLLAIARTAHRLNVASALSLDGVWWPPVPVQRRSPEETLMLTGGNLFFFIEAAYLLRCPEVLGPLSQMAVERHVGSFESLLDPNLERIPQTDIILSKLPLLSFSLLLILFFYSSTSIPLLLFLFFVTPPVSGGYPGQTCLGHHAVDLS